MDELVAENKVLHPERCETCGTEIIDNCLRCGAPRCCPHCCYISELQVKNEKQLLAGHGMWLAGEALLIAPTNTRYVRELNEAMTKWYTITKGPPDPAVEKRLAEENKQATRDYFEGQKPKK